jgi:hypothetical protein
LDWIDPSRFWWDGVALHLPGLARSQLVCDVVGDRGRRFGVAWAGPMRGVRCG